MKGNLAEEYALLCAGEEVPMELRARARRDQVRATGRAIASIDRLFEAAGATALNNDQALQRFWRDAHAGRVHAANDAERAYYLAARKRHGGIGICKVEGRTCSGCHVDISPGELDAMRLAPADELPECPNCARSLVR